VSGAIQAGDQAWSTEPPTEPGDWLFKCDEVPNPHVLKVSWKRANNRLRQAIELFVECPDTGCWPVDVYHGALCNPMWRKV
jgi:hypothetical protein